MHAGMPGGSLVGALKRLVGLLVALLVDMVDGLLDEDVRVVELRKGGKCRAKQQHGDPGPEVPFSV